MISNGQLTPLGRIRRPPPNGSLRAQLIRVSIETVPEPVVLWVQVTKSSALRYPGEIEAPRTERTAKDQSQSDLLGPQLARVAPDPPRAGGGWGRADSAVSGATHRHRLTVELSARERILVCIS